MAPIKFEEHIREKLQEREITPSAGAWEKLSGELEEDNRSNTKFIWLAIAASFIGVLIVGSVLINSEIAKETPALVKENTEKVEAEIKQEKAVNPVYNDVEIIPEIIQEVAKTSVEEIKEKPVSEKKNITFQKKSFVTPIKQTVENTAVTQVEKEEQFPLIIKKSIETQKIEEVVAQVQQLQNQNKEVTAAEIDALLTNAQKELQTQRILASPKVDPMALLQDVESEMERSFRDKVFDALGKRFNEIRTAVVERNN